MKKVTRARWRTGLLLALLSLGGSMGALDDGAAQDRVPLPEASAEEAERPAAGADPSEAAPDTPPPAPPLACRVAAEDAQLIEANTLCEDCSVDAAVIELIFDRVVDTASIARSVQVEPAVELASRSGDCARRVLLGGSLAEQTDYVATLAGGQALRFATRGGYPRIRMPNPMAVVGTDGEMPVQLSDLRRARLRVIPLRPDEIATAAQIGGRFSPDDDPVTQLPASLQRRVRERALERSDGDEMGVQRVDPFQLAGQRGPVLALVDSPGVRGFATIVQRATHAVVMKVGAARGLVWVVDARTGAPAANASVTVYQGATVRRRGRTDRSGLFFLPAEPELRRDPEGGPLRAVAQVGNETAYTSDGFQRGIDRWQFDLPYVERAEDSEMRGMVTAERGIYRPTETVHLLGILRELSADGRLRAPRGQARVVVRDPDGDPLIQEDVRLSAYGTFRHELAIPRTARLGRYRVDVTRDGHTLHHRFEVGEYRPDTFEVTLAPSGPAELEASNLVVPVSARYFYGSPVRNGRVSWQVSWRPRRISVPGVEGFTFGRPSDSSHLGYGTSGQLTLDDEGRGRIVMPTAGFDRDWAGLQAVDLIVEASVTDAGDDVVSGTTVQVVSPEPTWFGLRSERWVVDSTRGWDLSTVAVSRDSSAPTAGAPMRVRLMRREWRSYAERGHGGVRYHGEYEEVEVAERELTSETTPSQLHFDLPGGGRYRAQLIGELGEVLAEVSTYAYGGGASMPVLNHPRMELVADRPSYEPGQQAQIFASVPWTRSVALVTVEREGVIEARVQQLDGVATPIPIAVDEAHAPNVFVSVAALPLGPAGASVASGVPIRVGYRELEVSPEARRLAVEVTPVRTEVRPGEDTTVDVVVRDQRGRPVRSEVTLWAADEGVLQLTGYRTPDPFAPAYARRPNRVSTTASPVGWTLPDPDTWNDGGGDGQIEGGSALRSRFLSTAFFSQAVVTDRLGRARVRFAVPDNLTRWRVMAAVADRGERFGRGEASMTASKPLSAMPSLPRFLTQGDLVDAGLVIHNQTGRRGTARVRFEVDGPAVVQGPSSRQIELEPDAQVPVRFAVLANAPGTLTVVARVEMGGEDDGFSVELPVHPATAWSHEQVGSGLVEGVAEDWIHIPDSLEGRQVELTVTASPSVYASMERGVDSLFHYPNGCVEQTTSGLIPMVLLEDLMRDIDPERFASTAHRARMNEAIAHVLRHQNYDGGFGLWPTSDSEGFLTAYALWGLLTARDHGYPVGEVRTAAAVHYLAENATQGDDMHGQFSDAETPTFAAYVLAYAQQSDGGLSTRLAAERDRHSRFALGLLANALTRREAEGAGSLLAGLDNSEHEGAHLIEEAGEGLGFMSFGHNLRATSSAVQAMVAAGQRDEASDLVAGILDDRQPDGSWGTTYNNMWALYALTAFAESERRVTGPVSLEIRLDGSPVGQLRLAPEDRAARLVIGEAELPRAGHSARLSVHGPNGTRVRYEATLRHVVAARHQRAQRRGLTVTRELLDADSGEPVEHPVVGQLLRVRLRVQANRSLQQVSVMDRLPAGLEAVDTSLATRAGSFGSNSVVSTRRGYGWSWREIHDERVTFFADYLSPGTRDAEYLARATRSGEFVLPAARAEAMYDPAVYGTTAVGRTIVTRARR